MTRRSILNTPEAHFELLIERAKANLRPTSNLLADATWLTSGERGSATWKTKSPGTEKILTIHFNRRLTDGSMLTDEENRELLLTIQDFAYFLRMGKLADFPIAPADWEKHVSITMNLASWVKLNDDRFMSGDFGFKLFTKDDCKELLDDIGQGGWTRALRHKERMVMHFHQAICYPVPVENLLEQLDNLDIDFLQQVTCWLNTNNLYAKDIRHKHIPERTLSRNYLIDKLGIFVPSADYSLRAFIRQFEPLLAHDLLITATNHKSLPSQNTVSLTSIDGKVSESQHKNIVTKVLKFFSAHTLLPNQIPDIDISNKDIKTNSPNLRRGGHTKLIPLTIGLNALNDAIKWVLQFGATIIEASTYYAKEYKQLSQKYSQPHASRLKSELFSKTKKNWLFQDISTGELIPLCDELNIETFYRPRYTSFNPSCPAFVDVVHSFVGACVILIAILKPIRDKEISTLPRACLQIEVPDGGSKLHHSQGKQGILGINAWITRPIPSITARAIQLLQALGNQLSKIYEDESEHGTSSLFYFPGAGFKKPKHKDLYTKINRCLDFFCDLIKTPTDKNNRRWYIRTHEMRKFFLLTMHRHGGESILDVLRYQAGHIDRDHINAYIEPESYDELYIQYESECVEDRLIALSRGEIDEKNNQGLVELYKQTCAHFKVTNISSIPSDAFKDMLQTFRKNNIYEISTYTIKLPNYDSDVQSMEFAVKIGEHKDAAFNR